MITVQVLINGKPIRVLHAKRIKNPNAAGKALYRLWEPGDPTILHNPQDGALELAAKMLRTAKDGKVVLE